MDSLRACPAFAAVVLLTLGVLGLIGLMLLLMQLQPGFMGMAHGTEPHHRVHDLTFGFLLSPVVVGLLAQLRTPSRNAGIVVLIVAVLFPSSTLPAVVLGATDPDDRRADRRCAARDEPNERRLTWGQP